MTDPDTPAPRARRPHPNPAPRRQVEAVVTGVAPGLPPVKAAVVEDRTDSLGRRMARVGSVGLIVLLCAFTLQAVGRVDDAVERQRRDTLAARQAADAQRQALLDGQTQQQAVVDALYRIVAAQSRALASAGVADPLGDALFPNGADAVPAPVPGTTVTRTPSSAPSRSTGTSAPTPAPTASRAPATPAPAPSPSPAPPAPSSAAPLVCVQVPLVGQVCTP